MEGIHVRALRIRIRMRIRIPMSVKVVSICKMLSVFSYSHKTRQQHIEVASSLIRTQTVSSYGFRPVRRLLKGEGEGGGGLI